MPTLAGEVVLPSQRGTHLSCALAGLVAAVYQTFGPVYQASFVRFARQAISNAAQLFTPGEFWHNRAGIQDEMRDAVARALLRQGHAIVEDLQLMRVEFSEKYEEIVLMVQLQEQLRTTKRCTRSCPAAARAHGPVLTGRRVLVRPPCAQTT